MSTFDLKNADSSTGSLAAVLDNERGASSSARKPVKELYNEFATSTSAHGFQYTVGGSRGKRAFGVVVICVFIVIASVFTFQAISDFFSGPGFSSEYKLVYTRRSDPQPLDVFALCDIAPWDFKKAEAANISAQMISYLAYTIFVFDAEKNEKDQTVLKRLETEYIDLVDKYGSARELMNAVTRSCEDAIFICFEGIGKQLSGQECCQAYFNEPVFTTEGKCYGTAGKMKFKQQFPAKPQGLTIGMSLGADISKKMDITVGPVESTLHRGVSIVLTGESDHLFLAAMRRAYLVMPNTLNSFPIEKTVIDSSGLEACVQTDDAAAIRLRSPGYRRYSQDNCFMGQLREIAKARMKCHLPMLPNPDGTQECSPSQVVDAFSLINSDAQRKDTRNPLGEADSQCPQDCVQATFSARMTSQQITPAVQELRSRLLNAAGGGKGDVVAFQIHYPSFDFIQTVQHATGFASLLGTIGGTLGLWIGASVFTLLEFIVYFFRLLSTLVQSIYKRTNKS